MIQTPYYKETNEYALKKVIEELDLTTFELAELISKVFTDCYGSHNYELFKDVIEYELGRNK